MSNVNDFVIENGRLQKYIGEKENVVVPDNVISIEKQAFAFCESVTSIVIPNSVTVIGDGAFEGCKSMAVRHCRISQFLTALPPLGDTDSANVPRLKVLPFRKM